jgi:hypothetical protein
MKAEVTDLIRLNKVGNGATQNVTKLKMSRLLPQGPRISEREQRRLAMIHRVSTTSRK